MSASQDEDAGSSEGARDTPVAGKFLVCAVAFLRAKQLAGGARPRVDEDWHKLERLAIREVMAEAVSWSQV